MPEGTIVRVQAFAEHPDYMPPDKVKNAQLPEGFLIYADNDIDAKGALLRFVEQAGGCRPVFVDRISDDNRKAFYAGKISRAKPSDNWTLSEQDGRRGIRYSIVVEYDNSGCYIATACYGDCDADEVRFFRRFRDDCLLQMSGGKRLVAYYYRYSPSVANLIQRSKLVRTASRNLVLRPLMHVLRLLTDRN